jgi:hypothetical protein
MILLEGREMEVEITFGETLNCAKYLDIETPQLTSSQPYYVSSILESFNKTCSFNNILQSYRKSM